MIFLSMKLFLTAKILGVFSVVGFYAKREEFCSISMDLYGNVTEKNGKSSKHTGKMKIVAG